MQYAITHETRYEYTAAIPLCHNQVHLLPRTSPLQRCLDYDLSVQPAPSHQGSRNDYFGNQVDFFSIVETHQELKVRANSSVEVTARELPPLEDSPNWESIAQTIHSQRDETHLRALEFTLGSRHVATVPTLADFAKESFASNRPILAAARDLTARIHDEFQYDGEATAVDTSVEEVMQIKRGVCQDFAHLQIGCLRSLGLAARYVSGYLRTEPPPGQPRLVGADASHAWISVFCGHSLGWVDFDPTTNLIASTDHVTIGWGRDYADVCPVEGVITGDSRHKITVAVDVVPIS